MRQESSGVVLDQSIGYALKQAATALRAAMETVLWPLDLTVAQYSCLEVLGQTSGLSNAELARATFVSRQAMNGVLRGLQHRELVTRPATASRGRALPATLTTAGHQQLRIASAAVRSVEEHMLQGLSAPEKNRFRNDLLHCVTALGRHP